MRNFAKVIINRASTSNLNPEIFAFFEERQFEIKGHVDLDSGYQIIFDQISNQIKENNIKEFFISQNKVITQQYSKLYYIVTENP